jgi:hypothetical protein
MYGALEGLSKPQLAATTGLGKEQVQAYRTALDARPPPMSSDHPLWYIYVYIYICIYPYMYICIYIYLTLTLTYYT